MNYLEFFKEDFLQGEPVKRLLEGRSYHSANVAKERFRWWRGHNLIKVEEFLKMNVNFSQEELKDIRIKSKNTSSMPVLFEVSQEFLEFCGLWLGDGSYDNYNENSVIISNIDKECRETFDKVASYLGANSSLMKDGGVSLRIHSTVFYKFMKKVMKFDG